MGKYRAKVNSNVVANTLKHTYTNTHSLTYIQSHILILILSKQQHIQLNMHGNKTVSIKCAKVNKKTAGDEIKTCIHH